MTTRRAAPVRRRRSSKPRGRLSWTTATLNEFNTGIGGQTAFDTLGGFTQAEKLGIAKVIRVHLRFNYVNATLNSQAFGRYGLIVENDDAVAAGAHLDPIGDGDGPWLINDFYHADQSVAGDQFEQQHDLKAQRLIKPKFSLEFVLDVDSASNGSLNWNVGMRILLEHR